MVLSPVFRRLYLIQKPSKDGTQNSYQYSLKSAIRNPQSAINKRILVYRTGSLGDTIITLPAFHVLRENFPDAFIALLNNATEDKETVLAQSVLPAMGLFDDWLTYPTDDFSLKAQTKLLFKIRSCKFDTLVYLSPRIRTAKQIKRDLAFFYLAGIRNFIGHKNLPLPLPVKEEDKPLPFVTKEADHFLDRLRLSGLDVPSEGEGSMDLRLKQDEMDYARDWLEKNCGDYFAQKKIFAVAPTSLWQSKIWAEERFAELGARLIEKFDLFPVIFGSSDDRACGERLISFWKRGANAAGELNVRRAAAALSFCRLYVGNDTGTMHLAAAVGTKCVAIFSAHSWPGWWYPYGEGHISLREVVPCESCLLRICDKDNLCLKMIEVEDVFKACERVLVSSQ